MAKYSDIKGFTVQTLASDTVASQAEGGSWASGGDLNTARSSVAGAGTQTAAIMFGGNTPAPSPYPQPYYLHDETESYNGTSFTEVADLNTARGANRGGFGTSTAGFLAGGYTYPPAGPTGAQQICESWNGSAWSETTDFNTKRYSFGCSVSAPYTSSIITGGYTGGPPPSQINDAVEIWNGSSWTETTETNSTKGGGSGAGTSSTAAIVVGPTNSTVESWDGSSWTEVAEMTTTRSSTGSAGTYTSALWFGGPSSSAKTEFWNGTSWTELNDLSTGRGDMGEAGGSSGSTSSFAAGGTPPVTAVSEEWTAPSTFTKQVEGQLFFNSTTNTFKETITDFPAGTWASGANMSQPRGRAGFASNASSTTHVAMTFGGNVGPGTPGKTVNTEQYDGTSWTEVNNINTVRAGYGGGGTLTSSIYAGGEDPLVPPSNTANVELWDGTNWTETTNLNVAVRSNVGFGATNTAIISASGYTTTAVATTEKWDGSSWTEVGDQNAAKYARGGTGTVTDGILFGGQDPTTNTETWDGTSWTEVSELNSAGEYRAASGNSSSLVLATGKYPLGANVEFWNGSSWSEINDISTARWEGSGTGSSSFGLISGGHPGTPNNYATATEEFTVTLGNKTITAS